MTSRLLPVVLMDVDGVLNPVCDAPPEHWGDWRPGPEGTGGLWSASMADAVRDLAARAELRWLTTWWDKTDRLAFLGLGPAPVANTREEYLDRAGGPLSWWKLNVARRVLTEGRPVVWVDDDLAHDPRAVAWVRSVGTGRLLPVCPDTQVGLTPYDVGRIDRGLDRTGPGR
jgi:hypothetical protein